MKEIVLSIIVPIYNVESYLKKCLDSLVLQEMDGIEILLIEDGSRDDSKMIAQTYSEKYENIILICHENNKGLGAARNTGIKHAKGEYITFVDSDDWVSPIMYNKMLNTIIEDKSDIVVCGINEVLSDKIIVKKCCDKEKECISSEEALKRYFDVRITAHAWNKVYKRSLFNEHNIKYAERKYAEDQYPTFLLIYYSNKISLLRDSFYFYNRRNDSLTTSRFSKKNYDVIDNFNNIKLFLKENCIYNKYEEYFKLKFYYIISEELCTKFSISKCENVNYKEHKNLIKNICNKNFTKITWNKKFKAKDKFKILLMKYYPGIVINITKFYFNLLKRYNINIKN